MSYYNPDNIPEQEEISRKITIRFRNKEDYKEFMNQTGIFLDKESQVINFSRMNLLEDIF